jgi:hypothetical protein
MMQNKIRQYRGRRELFAAGIFEPTPRSNSLAIQRLAQAQACADQRGMVSGG